MPTFNFVPESTVFKLANAYSLALAAELAYGAEPQIRATVIDQWECDGFRYFEKRGARGFVMSNASVVIVAFGGIEPSGLPKWIANLDLDLTKGPLGGRVHAGCQKRLNRVWDDIERAIHDLRGDRPKSLWFTGHGFGGALATLAAARLVAEDRPVYGLYTFGSPRVGDRKFARGFNFEFRVRAFRFVNNNDTVTRIPPRSAGYSHVGTFRYLTDKGEMVDDMGWWYQFLDRIGGPLDEFSSWGDVGLKDHRIEEYRERLERLVAADQ